MARVTIATDDGRVVEEYAVGAEEVRSLTLMPLRGNLMTGIRRALQDAEVVQAGGDPERPSEKAMRLAEQAEEYGA